MASDLVPSPLFSSRPKLQSLLTYLHKLSLEQEKQKKGSQHAGNYYPKDIKDEKERLAFEEKLVALEEDKASALYVMLRATNAQRIFEGGFQPEYEIDCTY